MDNRCRCSTTFSDPIFWVWKCQRADVRVNFLPLHFLELSLCCLWEPVPSAHAAVAPLLTSRIKVGKCTKPAQILHGILPENAEKPPFRGFCRTPALPCSASNVQSSSDDRELQLRQVFREMTLYEREQFCFVPNPKVLARGQWLGKKRTKKVGGVFRTNKGSAVNRSGLVSVQKWTHWHPAEGF